MRSRWRESEANGSECELLAYAARLLGADDSLVLPGGGNVSLKRQEMDAIGRRVSVLFVKPSGGDMSALRAEDLVALDLEHLEPHAERVQMDDADRAAALARAHLGGTGRPSAGTLLHAFLPDRWILHTHPDALLALCNRPDGAARVLDVLGNDVVLVGYLSLIHI